MIISFLFLVYFAISFFIPFLILYEISACLLKLKAISNNCRRRSFRIGNVHCYFFSLLLDSLSIFKVLGEYIGEISYFLMKWSKKLLKTRTFSRWFERISSRSFHFNFIFYCSLTASHSFRFFFFYYCKALSHRHWSSSASVIVFFSLQHKKHTLFSQDCCVFMACLDSYIIINI